MQRLRKWQTLKAWCLVMSGGMSLPLAESLYSSVTQLCINILIGLEDFYEIVGTDRLSLPYWWNEFWHNIGLQRLKSAILALYVKFYTWLNISSLRLTAECGKGDTVLTGGRKTKPLLEGFCYDRPRRTRIE